MSREESFENIQIKELALRIGKAFKSHGIDSTLVGGACVSIYSKNLYQSYDLDYVTWADMNDVKEALKELGFYKKGKYFVHDNCPFFIDFVSPPVAIGTEPVRKFKTIKSSIGEIKLLSATDCVKDRLASFYYWDDTQALEQAILVCQQQTVDFSEIERWSKQENFDKNYQLFLKLVSSS